MDPAIVSALAGTSGLIGLLALLAYFFYSYQVHKLKQSVRRTIEGESAGLFNAEKVVDILRSFETPESRLAALNQLIGVDDRAARRVYGKIEGSVNLEKWTDQDPKKRARTSLLIGLFFILIALIGLAYSGITPKPPTSIASTATPAFSPSATVTPSAAPSPTATPKASPTSEDPNLQAKFDELLNQATSAEAKGDWSVAADKYRQAGELRPDDQKIKRKLERARYLSRFRMANGLDVVVFSACDDAGAVERIYRLLQRVFPTVLLDNKKCLQVGQKGDSRTWGDWGYEYDMVRSRIYFLGGGNADAARFIAEWLPGDQEVVDYNPQYKWGRNYDRAEKYGQELPLIDYFNPGALPDSRSPYDYMQGIYPDRALALFVGSEYAAIETFLNAWIDDRPLREEEKDMIKETEAKQREEWSKLTKDWEQRKNDWVNYALVKPARKRCGFGSDWKVSYIRRFTDHLHVEFLSNAGLVQPCDYYWPTH